MNFTLQNTAGTIFEKQENSDISVHVIRPILDIRYLICIKYQDIKY